MKDNQRKTERTKMWRKVDEWAEWARGKVVFPDVLEWAKEGISFPDVLEWVDE